VSLLSEQDRSAVRRHLSTLQRPVTLLFFTQTIGAPESALMTRLVLDELASLSDLVTVEEANFVLDKDRAQAYGIDHIPAIVLLSGDTDSGMRFLGAPSGYEFSSLIEAVVLAGTSDSGLTPESRALIAAHVTVPTDVKVFVTPTCPHCPRAVTLAHRMARENPLIRATCVEASEFIELSRKFRVTGVPKTVVNESIEVLGALPEDLFVRTVLGLPESESPGGAS
jgi:glutaredoxin-like protein